MRLELMVEGLKKVYGDNLSSVVLYGSAAGPDFERRFSDYNLMVVLSRVNTSELARAARLTRRWTRRRWRRRGNPTPLLVDRDWLRSSCDAFPIEFQDILDRRRVLAGEDPFAGLEVHPEHLRLECEQELKGKILALRVAFLRACPSRRRIRRILLESSGSLFAVFRGVLRLKGEAVPPTRREVLRKLNEKTAFETGILDRILDVREGRRKMPAGEALEWFDQYLTTLKDLAKLLDQ